MRKAFPKLFPAKSTLRAEDSRPEQSLWKLPLANFRSSRMKFYTASVALRDSNAHLPSPREIPLRSKSDRRAPQSRLVHRTALCSANLVSFFRQRSSFFVIDRLQSQDPKPVLCSIVVEDEWRRIQSFPEVDFRRASARAGAVGSRGVSTPRSLGRAATSARPDGGTVAKGTDRIAGAHAWWPKAEVARNTETQRSKCLCNQDSYEDECSRGVDGNAHPTGCRAKPSLGWERRWAEWICRAKRNLCCLLANSLLVLGALSHQCGRRWHRARCAGAQEPRGDRSALQLAIHQNYGCAAGIKTTWLQPRSCFTSAAEQ